MELSIVIPVYKSKEILPELIRRIETYITPLGISFEVVLIDDCSQGGEREVIKNLQSKYSYIRTFENSKNRGLPYTSKFGIAQSEGKYIVTIDDDLEYCPSDILILYEKILTSDTDVVFGIAKDKYRIKGSNSELAHFRNKILNFIWQKPITDSFKIFKRDIAFNEEEFLIETHFEGFLKSKKSRVKIEYAEVSYYPRYRGRSNYTFFKKVRMFFQMHKGF